MPFVQCLWLEVFVEKRVLSHYKTLKTVAMETKVCYLIKLWTSFQKNLIVSCSYKRNMVFKRAQCAIPNHRSSKKKPGLDRVNLPLPSNPPHIQGFLFLKRNGKIAHISKTWFFADLK